MIEHGYEQCQGCHVDPGGGGMLTKYGRAMSEILLAMPWAERREDPSSVSEFLWGAFKIPEPLLLGGQVRVMQLQQKVAGVPLKSALIYMQLDAEAAIVLERFVASGTLGYAPEGALGAALTRGSQENLVSRRHWIGYQLARDKVLLRAGRMNLPYGIRNIEHTLWSRAVTRTSINDQQQYGLSLSLEMPELRGELMAILGNFQQRPDVFRERGYSGYLEVPVLEKLVLGASSLITHREFDPRFLSKTFRQAHGLMLRWATPYEPLVVLSEWNYVLESPKSARWRRGIVGHAQVNWQVTQGIHFLLTGEANSMGVEGTPLSYGTWLSYAWFFAPHADVRLDAVYQNFRSARGDTDAFVFLAQVHVAL
jgi:hypothetical protein